MISKALDYSLRAIVYMAANDEIDYFGVKELSKSTRVSPSYLGKVLQNLVRQGYLKSTTGPGGGFGLARSPSSITIMELISAIDGRKVMHQCFLGMADCSDSNPCPIHPVWKEHRDELVKSFGATTVEDIRTTSWPAYLKRTAPKKTRTAKS